MGVFDKYRDQASGRLGRNGLLAGSNFSMFWAEGEV